MAGLFFNVLIICVFLVSLSPAASAAPQKTSLSKQQSCTGCHGEFSSVLPAKHPRVTGKDISACMSCHVPDPQNKAATEPYSSKLHLSHMQPDAKLDCLTCHTWKPGKTFGVKGAKKPLGTLTTEGMDQIRQIFASWASSKYLDAHHGKKNVTCSACHERKLPESGDTVASDRCLVCHGDIEKLAKKTEPKDFPDRNPHKSHLGTIDCVVCHKAHQSSKAYCLDCHKNFNMKIRFGEGGAGAKNASGTAK